MGVGKLENLEIYRKAFEIQKIGNEAVQKALAAKRKKGIPIVFSRKGTIYYELPSGEITTKSPFEDKTLLEKPAK